MIDFDVILTKIGALGRYQTLLVVLVFYLAIPSGLHNVASVFYAANTEYSCNVPPLDNKTLYPSLTDEDIQNYTTPKNSENSFDGCKRYGYDLETCVPPELTCVDKTAPVINCDKGYHFYFDEFDSTTLSEWDLVCGRSILSTMATSFFFAGMWFGAILFGYIGDRYGRKLTLLITTIGSVLCGVGVGLTPWFELFVVLRFLTAAFSHGGYLMMFVYVVEITGPKRNVTGIHSHSAFAIGYSLNSLFAYFLRDWRAFYIAISLTPLPYLIMHFFVPESPRWYFSNGRDEEGKKLAEVFAKRNGKILTEQDWQDATIDEKTVAGLNMKYSFLDLFKHKQMRSVILKMMFCWFATALVYYGLSLNAGSLSGNIFINNALNGCIELVAYFFVQYTIDILGRRVLLCSMFTLQGVSCILSTVLTELADGNEAMETAATVFAFVGKCGVSACFSIVYNYCAELFPTVVRGNALGVSSMASRWGSISSPYLIFLQDYVSWLPFTIFGAVALLAAFLTLFLPETKGVDMMQTMEEAENFYKRSNNYSKREKTDDFKSNTTNDEYFKNFDDQCNKKQYNNSSFIPDEKNSTSTSF